jgi:hypothetical protein
MQIPILSGVRHERFYVYEHLRADNGNIFYVGKGTGNRCNIKNRHHRNEFWLRTEKKAGGFSVKIVANKIDEELAHLVEIERISQLRKLGVKLCNMTDGGDGLFGYEKSPECRQKIGSKHKGKKIPDDVRKKISHSVRMSGYAPSDEARKKMSDAHIGKKRSLGYRHSKEWKASQSLRLIGNKSRLGQKRSEEERHKVSRAMSGRAQAKKICPHCQAVGGNAMLRWHFDNCRSKK